MAGGNGDVMFKFVRQVFRETVDISDLTVRILREKYLAENGIGDLSASDRKAFTATVEKVLLEYSNSNAEMQKQGKPQSKKKSEVKTGKENCKPDICDRNCVKSSTQSNVDGDTNSDSEEEPQNATSQVGHSKRKRAAIDDSSSDEKSKSDGLDSSDEDAEETLPESAKNPKKRTKRMLPLEESDEDSDETLAYVRIVKETEIDVPKMDSSLLEEKQRTTSSDKNQKKVALKSKTLKRAVVDPGSDDISNLWKDHSNDDDSSDEQLSDLKNSNKKYGSNVLSKNKFVESDSSDDLEEPLSALCKKSLGDKDEQMEKSSNGSELQEENRVEKSQISSSASQSEDDAENPLPTGKGKLALSKSRTIAEDKSCDDSNSQPSGSSDEEPLQKIRPKNNSTKINGNSKKKNEIRKLESVSEDSLEEELLTVSVAVNNKRNNKSAMKSVSADSKSSKEDISEQDKSCDDSNSQPSGSSDEEPLQKIRPKNESTKRNGNLKKKNEVHKLESVSEDSLEEELLTAVNNKRKNKSAMKSVSADSKSSNEDISEQEKNGSCSDEVPLSLIASRNESNCKPQKERKNNSTFSQKQKIKTSNEESDDDEPLAAIKTKKKGTYDKKDDSKISDKNRKEKAKDSENPAIARMKRYIRAVGLFVNYSKVLAECTTNKKKIQKLSEILEEAGMKGKPTLEKCRKLKAKRERQKEVSELDIGNIICDSGRSRRNASINRVSDSGCPNFGGERQQAIKKTFLRLKGIIDSEESD